ncbi:NAD(P)/FAD-dependent oxidoreductase [Paraburkholderia sp. Cy-641]|nr:NAD(P)/FAD-dependent oxidoreductase [Paraburkholderia sp. Cy-641]
MSIMSPRSTKHPTYDAIVIGGGHNGLVSAFYLARAGRRVLVLERRRALGGPCGTVEYFPGHRSSITNSTGSLEQTIAADMQLERHGLRFISTDPTLFTRFDTGRYFVGWRDQNRVREQLASFAKGDEERFFGLLAYVDRFAQALGVSPFEPPPSLRDMLAKIDSPELEDAFGKFFFGSIRDLAEEWLQSEEARALIAIRGCVAVQAGPSTPGTAVPMLIRPLSLAARKPTSPDDPRLMPLRGSTGFPKGGMGAIIAAMARAVVEAGGEIRTDVAVRRILVENGAAVGVETASGECFRAPVVVSNANPKTTLLDLLPAGAIRANTLERVRRIPMKGSAFKIALSLDRPPHVADGATDEETRQIASCQFRIAPSVEYMDRAFDQAKHGVPSERPLMWGLCPSMIDPDLAPPGRHLLSINVWHAPYALKDGVWDAATRDAFGDRCIKVLDEYMPGIKDSIVDHRYMSPLDLENEYGLLEGNVIQGDNLAGQMFSLRPMAGMSDYRAPVDGLYFCGTGTWPAGFVSGIPGHNAAHQILSDTARRNADCEMTTESELSRQAG